MPFALPGPSVMTAQPSESELDDWVRLGGMAPSGGNAQPWKVIERSGALHVSLDPKRTDSFLDIQRMASIFSSGCFIENVCLGAAAAGWKTDVEVHETVGERELATLRFVAGAASRDSLHQQIPRRHTNRRLHEGPPLPEDVIVELSNALGERTNTRLSAISGPAQKHQAAACLGEGESIFLRHPLLFAGMTRELRWTNEEAQRTGDGVAISTLELPGAAVRLLRALRACPPLRHLLPRAALKKMPEGPVIGCSHLCLMAVRGVLTTAATIAAGRAAQRLWLRATELELALQPLAALPFMLLRATQFDGAGFNAAECRQLRRAGEVLRVTFGLTAEEFPLFVFRLSRALPPSDRALRLPHRELYLRG